MQTHISQQTFNDHNYESHRSDSWETWSNNIHSYKLSVMHQCM